MHALLSSRSTSVIISWLPANWSCSQMLRSASPTCSSRWKIISSSTFASGSPVTYGETHDVFAVRNGHGHLGAQQVKLLLRLAVHPRLVTVTAQNSGQSV